MPTHDTQSQVARKANFAIANGDAHAALGRARRVALALPAVFGLPPFALFLSV